MMKKLISIIALSLLFCMALISPVSASNHDGYSHAEEENHEGHVHTILEEALVKSNGEIIQLALANTNTNPEFAQSDSTAEGEFGVMYVPCEYGGKHQMTARGFGIWHLPNGSIFTGNLFQCKNCALAVNTTFNIFNVDHAGLGPGIYYMDTLPIQVGDKYTYWTDSSKRTSTSWSVGFPFDGMSFYK